jgi:hypothetical protein
LYAQRRVNEEDELTMRELFTEGDLVVVSRAGAGRGGAAEGAGRQAWAAADAGQLLAVAVGCCCSSI